MVDLIVQSGSVLVVDAAHPLEPKYGLFRMQANATIRAGVDVVLRADRAEFDVNCLIDARGGSGPAGQDAPGNQPPASANGTPGAPGGAGAAGLPAHSVSIEAGLARVGALTVLADGGPGGHGGNGQPGSPGAPQVMFAQPGNGGAGGPGGRGGNAGGVSIVWTRLAPGLPSQADTAPSGHLYRAAPGPGGQGGTGGLSAAQVGAQGARGADGVAASVKVRWKASFASLLWMQKQDMGPAPRTSHDMAFDPGRGRLVLFGGWAGAANFGDTWEWDGQFWSQAADIGPSPRRDHAMAFDPASGRVLLFGGQDDGGAPLDDTWAWDGQGWLQLADTGPSARQGHAMAGDPSRSRIVLFGGNAQAAAGAPSLLDDTWEWEQGQWVQRQDIGPAARQGAKLAFEPEQAVVLLFGGSADPGAWAWDGTRWTEVANMGPPPRRGHGLCTADGGVILFGGIAPQAQMNPLPLNDTWAWFDSAWRKIQDIGPAPRTGHAMAYDPVGKIIGFGGATDQTTFQGDTWELAQHS